MIRLCIKNVDRWSRRAWTNPLEVDAAETITDANYADDLALFSEAMQLSAKDVGLHVNANKSVKGCGELFGEIFIRLEVNTCY